MSIYLKTNKKCRLNIVAEIFDFISTVQTAFCFKQPYLRSPTGKTVRPKDSLMTSAAAK